MPIEIEKKFRLTDEDWQRLSKRLEEIGANFRGEDFEENTLYRGPGLEAGNRVLRLRRVGDRAVLSFKERLPRESGVKFQIEEETKIDDAESMHAILTRLEFTPTVVYEKRRRTWLMAGAEVVLDELPFGLFMEIEGDEDQIQRIERVLETENIEVEHSTYPRLTLQHGAKHDGIVEARFEKSDPK